MLLSVEIPDALAKQLHLDGPECSRRALEIFALEGYRAGEFSRGQVSEALSLSFSETEELLKRNDISPGVTVAQYDRSSEALEKILAR